MAYLPMFVDISNQPVLVIGGGAVAFQKVKMLVDFGADVLIVAKEVCPDLFKLALANGNVAAETRDFVDEDIIGKRMVFVTTLDKEFNHKVASLCKAANIIVNVADDKDESSFELPSYVRENNLVAAFSSSFYSPVLTKYLETKEREILTPFLGELNEMLGKWKEPIIELFPTEESRNDAFAQLFDYALCAGTVPSDQEVEEVLASISMSL